MLYIIGATAVLITSIDHLINDAGAFWDVVERRVLKYI